MSDLTATIIPPLPEPALAVSSASIGVLGRAAFTDIVRERCAQIDEHGFTLEHDLGHDPSELARAGEAYLLTAIDQLRGEWVLPTLSPRAWPWQREAWRPGDARHNLVTAAAILWALIDRLDGPQPTEAEPQ